jgi:hypothetical protein
VETAFNTTTGWFGTDVTKFGTGNRQPINLDQKDGSGASNNGYGHPIHVDSQSQNSGASAGPIVAMLRMAEWSEVLMSLTSTWNSGDSSGEGLSQFSNITLFQTGHYDYYGSFVEAWLNGGQAWSSNNSKDVPSPNAARPDWVTTTFTGFTTNAGDQIHGDGDQVSYGCSLAFLYPRRPPPRFPVRSPTTPSRWGSCRSGATTTPLAAIRQKTSSPRRAEWSPTPSI